MKAKSVLCTLAITGLLSGAILVHTTVDLNAEDTKTYRIGLSVWTGYPTSVQGFKDGMAAYGFVEGENVEYFYKKSDGDARVQRQMAVELSEAHLDLVYSLTTPGTSIVKDVLSESIPIVFSIVTYPVDAGLIESFEYSGNNLVGTSNYVNLKHYITLLKTLLPNAKTIAIFHRKGEPNSKIQAANMIRLLKKAGFTVIDLEPTTVEEMRQMAEEVADEVDVFMTTTDTLCQGGGEAELVIISLQRGIPILSSNKMGIEGGSTFGPVVDFYSLGKMSAEMAVKILKNQANPSSLQSKLQEPPITLINGTSVAALGLDLPEASLRTAQILK